MGLPLGASLPSFLTVPAVTAAPQVKPIAQLLPLQVVPQPTVPASPPPVLPGTAGSVTTTTPGESDSCRECALPSTWTADTLAPLKYRLLLLNAM